MKKVISLLVSLCLFVAVCTIPAYAEVNQEFLTAARIVNEMESDSVMLAAIQEETPDASEWWAWYEDLPLTDEMYINKESVAKWLKVYVTLSDENKQLVNYNPLKFAEEQKNTDRASFLPMSGYEHKFDFKLWEEVKSKANCYAYALNTYGNEGYSPYPGQKSEGNIPSIEYMRTHIATLLEKDAPYYNGKTITKSSAYATPGTRQYKIACYFSDIDFHFYRQDDNGYFSHKRGTLGFAEQIDAMGILIINPATCNRNYGAYMNYNTFGGWFVVKY